VHYNIWLYKYLTHR